MNTGELSDKLGQWIKGKVEEAGCRGAVFGLSGGIDSSVVGALCSRSLGDAVLGVIMPCFSIDRDEEHARTLADTFSIPVEKVPLDNVYTALYEVLPDKAVDEAAKRLASANLKARLRMLTLYHFANRLKYLVIGSGNRSELAVGYFTKHGDSGVDILPLGNLIKAQVKEVAAYLGVPREIIDKPPSAGLWEGQTDEADLGFTYQQLDTYLLTGKTDDSVQERIRSMIAGCDHKRQTPPLPPF
ncbi:MAG: NAD(+) synthase [Dehalococcoidales bacterium]|nr:NAD(+) synthase [Dehalococcoidales bacterium]